MNNYLQDVFNLFENVFHPAAGKPVSEKKKRRSSVPAMQPKAPPDSLNIRDYTKRQDSFRRNPAP